MDFSRMKRTKRFRLGDLTDEQIEQLMNSVETDEETDYDSDDSVKDPDFVVDDIEKDVIAECLNEMENADTTDQFLDGLHISAFDVPSASSIFTGNNENYDEVGVDVEHQTKIRAENKAELQASTSSSRPAKRMRSPLPIHEEDGPSIEPSAGGFIGAALDAIQKSGPVISNITWRKKSMRLHINEVAFLGDSKLPPEVKCLKTPMELFSYFFTDKIIDLISFNTNLNAYRTNNGSGSQQNFQVTPQWFVGT
ncbi:uncharacterized protein LOC126882370 [Diabrotica virgifera virgifera]|uniref:Uncharacterized protein LOC114348100 n=1 Tax=Diabrotica virgifera virgifera TaxID=50390 RepID=A0A6P7HA37_DIAVI|nr:uncharacterized protein LOC126882370 [Diabrotica virgifera virgifera]